LRFPASTHRLQHGVGADPFGSYNLFSTNVILASITFVYFPDQKWPGLLINLFTLLGSVVGQLLFGFLADLYGRTRLYGIELVLVIVSTIGVATSSHGVGDLSFLGLFIWVSRIDHVCSYLVHMLKSIYYSGALSWASVIIIPSPTPVMMLYISTE